MNDDLYTLPLSPRLLLRRAAMSLSAASALPRLSMALWQVFIGHVRLSPKFRLVTSGTPRSLLTDKTRDLFLRCYMSTVAPVANTDSLVHFPALRHGPFLLNHISDARKLSHSVHFYHILYRARYYGSRSLAITFVVRPSACIVSKRLNTISSLTARWPCHSS